MEKDNFDPIAEQFDRIKASKKKETQQRKKKVGFDVKNYLNVKLSEGETTKKITIRILKLTPDSETNEPLMKVIHTHYLPSEKKSFICAKQTENLPANIKRECPFCDNRDDAEKMQKGASEAVWNKYKEIYKQNGSMINYIVRVIDRDDEDFGVKFWKFSEPAYKLIDGLREDNKADGIDIFDYENGKDLVITVENVKGNSKITSITAKNKQTPLASTKERINELVSDEKLWSDVYGIKPYEYLELLIQGKEPFFDKAQGIWVEKDAKIEDTTDEEFEDDYHLSEEESEYESGIGKDDDLPF
jgi:hypothetical protein